MTKIPLFNAKGTKDNGPEEKILRDKIERTIVETFELFGFSPMDTPVLERYDLLASKYAGGTEILKETFKLYDQGKRELGLRYDLTVPLCRFIGMNPSIKFPFKRYQIGSVYRDGPVSSDRLRVFTQCDVDIVGAKSMHADAECLLLAEVIFRKLKIPARIEVNNRKLLDGLLEDIGIPEEKRTDIILIIDKMKKISSDEIKKELEQAHATKDQIRKLFQLLKETKGTNKEILQQYKKQLRSRRTQEGLDELEQIFSAIPYADKKKIVLTPTLARGLAYYTGTVYEAIAEEEQIYSSIAGGGRYDKMIQQFLGAQQEYPAVGISFGLDRISLLLDRKQKEKQKTVTTILVVPISTEKESHHIAEELRNAGIKTEIDLMQRGPSKNLAYANTQGIPFVLFVGEEELKTKKYTLKNMRTGEESKTSIESIKKFKFYKD